MDSRIWGTVDRGRKITPCMPFPPLLYTLHVYNLQWVYYFLIVKSQPIEVSLSSTPPFYVTFRYVFGSVRVPAEEKRACLTAVTEENVMKRRILCRVRGSPHPTTRGGPAPVALGAEGSLCPPRVAGATSGSHSWNWESGSWSSRRGRPVSHTGRSWLNQLVEPSQRARVQVNVGPGDNFHHRMWWKEDGRAKSTISSTSY